jgi:hypothetical protein
MQEQGNVLFNAFNNEEVVESLFPVWEQENISRTCTKIRGGGMEIFCPVWEKTLCFSTCFAVSDGMEDFFPRQAQALFNDFYHHMWHVKILPTPKTQTVKHVTRNT